MLCSAGLGCFGYSRVLLLVVVVVVSVVVGLLGCHGDVGFWVGGYCGVVFVVLRFVCCGCLVELSRF